MGVRGVTNKFQVFLGFVLILAMLVFGINAGNTNSDLPLFLFTGLILGYILTRARFGFAGGIKRIYVTGESSLTKALLIMFAFSIIGAAIIHMNAAADGAVAAFEAASGDAVIPGTSSVKFLNISTLVGGFLFGIGMMMAGGCASGTLSDLGEGEGRSAIALIFFVIGSVPGMVAKVALDESAIGQIGTRVYLPDIFGYIGAVIISFILLGILWVIAVKYEKFRKKEGFYEETIYEDIEQPISISENYSGAYKLYHKLFVQRWSFLRGGFFLTIMFLFIIISTGNSWGVTGSFADWGIGLFDKFGVELSDPVYASGLKKASNGFLNDPGSLRNIGIIFGAAIAFLLAGRFKFNFKFSLKDIIVYIVGGFLMGFGARIAGGCNIGALYSGIGNFSLAGWGFLVALSLGGIVGLKLFEGRVNIIPANRHLKKNA